MKLRVRATFGADLGQVAQAHRFAGTARTQVTLMNAHSVYFEAYAFESRPARNPPVHPDANCVADQIVLRHEANIGKAAVRTVIAVVTHEEVVIWRHNAVEISGHSHGRQHDQVVSDAHAFLLERRAGKGAQDGRSRKLSHRESAFA